MPGGSRLAFSDLLPRRQAGQATPSTQPSGSASASC